MSRIRWAEVVAHAREIVLSYSTGVTLRQLFYRLVADTTLPNTRTAYNSLSATTAKARRAGNFPRLIDRGRTIHEPLTWTDAEDARGWLRDRYRHDRTEGQPWSIYLGVEKVGLVNQLSSWFQPLGIPIVALSGYSSQTYVDEIADHVDDQGRKTALIYAGDFDPSGEDIDRDFIARCGVFERVDRIALTPEQVVSMALPVAMGKTTDSRAAGFIARHGALMQVELDAVPPNILQTLYTDAIAELWDDDAYAAALARERAERGRL